MTARRQGYPGLRRCRGFTLVEILVALLIMAVLSVLAYNAFDGILLVEQRSKEEFLAENRRSLATSILLNDFLHLRPRPARDELGGIREAYRAPSGNYDVEFTRGGLPDFPAMQGGIQRVAYRVEEGRLLRSTWQRVDSGPTPRVSDQVLADGIDDIRVEQLDSGGEFVPVWPPVNESLPVEAVPAMIRVTLRLKERGEISLLIPGPESFVGATYVGTAGNSP